jgi:hypothetical protein
MPVIAFRVVSRTELGRPINGPNGDTKYAIMISVKNIKGLSLNRAGEAKIFRKSTSGRSLAQCTAETPSEGARGVRILKETQHKRRLRGGRRLRGWGIVDRWHLHGDLVDCNVRFWQVFIRVRPKVTDSDWISYFQFGRLRSRPIEVIQQF